MNTEALVAVWAVCTVPTWCLHVGWYQAAEENCGVSDLTPESERWAWRALGLLCVLLGPVGLCSVLAGALGNPVAGRSLHWRWW